VRLLFLSSFIEDADAGQRKGAAFLMFVTRQEIIDYASRYVDPGEVVDFPMDSDLFCLVTKDLSGNTVYKDEDGWNFQGYGVCRGYTLDYEEKPLGKWIWMHYISLASFPPTGQVLKLQPPHVAKGRFQNPERTNEFRIIKIPIPPHEDLHMHLAGDKVPGKTSRSDKTDNGDMGGKIIQFTPKKKITGRKPPHRG
jgi:hypothetical protein